LEGGLQELEETSYWLELLSESGNVSGEDVVCLRSETEELLAILSKSVRTAKLRRDQEKTR
jgi:four helix bundle protein